MSPADAEHEEWVGRGEDGDAYTECLDLALKSLLAAEDCLLSAALTAPGFEMAVGTVASQRSALEASAQAFWLLAPGLGDVDRVRRFMRLTDGSVRASRGLMQMLSITDDEKEAKLAAIEALVAGFSDRYGGLGARVQRTQLVAELVEALNVPGDAPKAAYSWSSGMAHADKIGLDNIAPGRMPEAGDRAHYEASLERVLTWLFWAAMFGYSLVLVRAAEHMGWEAASVADELKELTDEVHGIFREIRDEVRDGES
jgi:hypothetical protein